MTFIISQGLAPSPNFSPFLRASLQRALGVYPEEAATFLAELEDPVRRHPAEVRPLLELATANLVPRDGRREQR